MSRLNGVIRQLLEWTLVSLAQGNTRLARSGFALLVLIAPLLAARVEFRRGNLTAARELATQSPGSSVYVRASQMLECLDADSFPDVKQRQTLRDFNGNVLFVVHSSPNFDPNGYGIRTLQILTALADTGINLKVTTRLGYPWDLVQHETLDCAGSSTVEGVEFMHAPHLNGIRQPELNYIESYVEYLVNLARVNDCTVIHAHSNFLNGIAGSIAARATGCRSIYEVRGLWHLTRASSEPGYESTEHFAYCEWMELQAASLADQVVAISNALKEWLITKGIEEQKISVVANAASRIEPAKLTMRQKNPPSLRIGYIGALTKYEGLNVLVLATKSLVDRGIAARTTIVGDGPEAKRLKKMVSELDLADTICFPGRIPSHEVPSYYNCFDVCVIPRIRTSVTDLVPPLKPFEIMGSGVPLVVSDLSPLADIVVDKERGLLFEAGSVESLVRVLEYVRSNPDACMGYAQTALSWVTQYANWEVNAGLYLKIYSADQPALAS